MARFNRLVDWLQWQETLHPNPIDLGLERIQQVMQRLGVAPRVPVISVAGTKGKGSCVALLDSMLSAGGYRVGAFTSPHLRRYNERIHVAGKEVSDASLCAAFARIDAARGDISLTYFEFNALAALLCFDTAGLDVWILEVGMGGRLDAVNVIDADVAIVTSIGLDHTEWLGNDLDSIAREKAGIYRAGRPAIYGSVEMPNGIQQVADQLGIAVLRAGRDFSVASQQNTFTWMMGEQRLEGLPLPALPGEVQLANAGCTLTALHLLQQRLPLQRAALERGLREVKLLCRLQRVTDMRNGNEWLLDVAHNAMSAVVLAQHLATLPRSRTLALLGVMADKDLDGMIAALSAHVDGWLPMALPSPRALPAATLATRLRALSAVVLPGPDTMPAAFQWASEQCNAAHFERVLVCGSFLAVGPALDWLDVPS